LSCPPILAAIGSRDRERSPSTGFSFFSGPGRNRAALTIPLSPTTRPAPPASAPINNRCPALAARLCALTTSEVTVVRIARQRLRVVDLQPPVVDDQHAVVVAVQQPLGAAKRLRTRNPDRAAVAARQLARSQDKPGAHRRVVAIRSVDALVCPRMARVRLQADGNLDVRRALQTIAVLKLADLVGAEGHHHLRLLIAVLCDRNRLHQLRRAPVAETRTDPPGPWAVAGIAPRARARQSDPRVATKPRLPANIDDIVTCASTACRRRLSTPGRRAGSGCAPSLKTHSQQGF
jgi:hypothetical protein